MTRRVAALAMVIVFGFGGIWIPPIWGAFRDDTRNPGNRFRVGEFAAPIVTATASAIATASEVVCDLGPLVTVCPAATSEPEPAAEPEPEPVAEPEPPATVAESEPVADGSQTDQPGAGKPSA